MQLTPHKRKQLSQALRKLEKKRALLKQIKLLKKTRKKLFCIKNVITVAIVTVVFILTFILSKS